MKGGIAELGWEKGFYVVMGSYVVVQSVVRCVMEWKHISRDGFPVPPRRVA